MTDVAWLRRWFWGGLTAVLAFRFWAAWWLPLTGDEAYFVTWGRAPALGVYDHPPMVGWILAGLLQVSQSAVVLRLPAILAPALIGLGMVALIRELGGRSPQAEQAAYAGALAWLLVPAQVLNVLITTDTPLVLFSALSIGAFALAVRRDAAVLYAAAGAALGLAFLSKYFAVLLGLAYVVFATVSSFARHGARRGIWRGLAIALAAALPFALVNAYWNYHHCWANVLFNLYTRHGDAGLQWWRPLAFLGFVAYVSSPILLWQLARGRPAVRAALAARAPRLLFVVAVAPLAALALVAPVRTIGLHWLLSFTPALFAFGALALGAGALVVSVRFLAVVSALHVGAVAVAAALPVETWQRTKVYDAIVQGAKAGELFAALAPWEGRYIFVADGFSPAAVLSYNAALAGFVAQPQVNEGWRRHYFPVLASTSHHGRQDDILTDLRAFEGRDLAIVRKRPPDPGAYERFFRSVETRAIVVRGATFHLVLGHGFDFAAYRARVLAEVRDRLFRIPSFLPQGGCYFCERYFGAATCPTR